MPGAEIKRVAFIRHGETPLHEGANRFCGDLDPDLTARGITQAETAGRLLPSLMPTVDATWMSPRLRTRHTATLVLPGADWQVFDDLRELAFGEWEGLTKEEAQALTPSAYTAWERDAYLNGPPRGESGHAAQPRIDRAIDSITSSLAQNILIVSHTTYLRLLIATLIRIPLSEARKRLDVQQGRIGLLEVSGRAGKLLALNL